jgi:hypothetical protein
MTAKTIADRVNKLTIWQIKRFGILDSSRIATLNWKEKWSDNYYHLHIKPIIREKVERLECFYVKTDASGEQRGYEFIIPLVTTSCNFGGYRYWFLCPGIIPNETCEKRVGVLYIVNNVIACRHCHNLTYESRNVSGKFKSFGKITSIPYIEDLAKEVKRKYYNGKITRKYKRFLLAQQKCSWIFNGHLGINHKRIKR